MADILWFIVFGVDLLSAAIFAIHGDVAKTILFCFYAYTVMPLAKNRGNGGESDG